MYEIYWGWFPVTNCIFISTITCYFTESKKPANFAMLAIAAADAAGQPKIIIKLYLRPGKIAVTL
jgi:hypothetical protein